MPVQTVRNCLMCQKEMLCTRASKLICSNVCHSKMHKTRVRLGLSNSEMIQKLKQDQSQQKEENNVTTND